MRFKRTLYFLLVLALVITVFSLTIGKDLYHGHPPNLKSYAITQFAGYLFFMVMPVEVAFVYYIKVNQNPVILISIAVGAAILAQMIDYACGYLASQQFIEKFVRKEKYEKAKTYIKKYGDITLFVFNVLPLSSPILILAAGMLKYPFKRVILFSLLGLIVKYIALALIF